MKVRTPLLVALAALSASTLAFADSGGLMRDHETTTELCGVGNYLFRSETGCQTNPSNIARTEPETHIADPSTSAASSPDLKKSFYFDMNQHRLTQEHRAMISDAVDFSKKNPNARFEIQGFADGTGNLEYNQSLAKTRASEVRKGLLNAGIPADRIALVKPAEAVSSSEDTMQDRKVELRVFRPAE